MTDLILPQDTDLLETFLKFYWFAPPEALWRAVEARAVTQASFHAPMLDLGCGHGRFALAVFGPQQSVTAGCDLLHFQLLVARGGGAYRTLACADGHHLPYPTAAFATVFSNSVLEHIPDPAPVLVEIARTLRPQGRLVITAPSDHFHDYLETPPHGDPYGYRAAIDQTLHHYHYHSPAQWAQLFHAAGLQPVSAAYYMAPAAARVWDRMNRQYGIGRRSPFTLLASPRLRWLGYQRLVARALPRLLDRRLRPFYAMDISPTETGAGLLLVAEKPA